MAQTHLHDLKIYQIDKEADLYNVSGLRLGTASSIQGGFRDDIYKEVFQGKVGTSNKLDLFEKFSKNGHPLFRGKPLKTSDIFVVDDCPYFKNPNGFIRLLDFDEQNTIKQESNVIDAIYVEVGKQAYETKITNELSPLQKAVDGYIETVYMGDNTVIICNDEAKLIGMEGNRHIGDEIIAGPFLIVGLSEDKEDFRSLSTKEKNYYLEKFKTPEFISRNEIEKDLSQSIIITNDLNIEF